MKKVITLIISLILSLDCSVFAQKLKEPDFIGDIMAVLPYDTLNLEHHLTQEKTRANAALWLTGIGKVSTKLVIDGSYSNTRIKNGEKPFLIVKVHDNNVSPTSIIQIFKFKVENNRRTAELNSWTTFGGASANNLTYVNYNVTKYGESSIKITFEKIDVGEYGILVRNGTTRDEAAPVISSFAIISDNLIASEWSSNYSQIKVVVREKAEIFKIPQDAVNKHEVHRDILSSQPVVWNKKKKLSLLYKVDLLHEKHVVDVAYVLYDKGTMWYYLVHESNIVEK